MQTFYRNYNCGCRVTVVIKGDNVSVSLVSCGECGEHRFSRMHSDGSFVGTWRRNLAFALSLAVLIGSLLLIFGS